MDDKKKEVASSMSLFLEVIFSTSSALGISLATSKKGEIILIDNETGMSKSYNPIELKEVFDEWYKSKKSV